jgi:CubicO group peptidase (beta-lactamase class C family)
MNDREAQTRAQAMLDELVERGEELGLQVAAYLDGRLVVDAWAGIADASTGRPVEADTLFTCFSCTKGITATVVHLLVQRGMLAYTDPIARFWPEFAANGKADITVEQALTHRAGIPHWPAAVQPSDLADWQFVCEQIARLDPAWEPGTRSCYHSITFGHILGELARRVDGRSLPRLVQEEICAPLGMSDLYLGLPDAVASRVAFLEDRVLQPGDPQPEPGSLAARAVPPAFSPLGEVFNRPEVRRACVPGAGGIMSARALARQYAALVGEVDGVRLLSDETVRIVSRLQTDEVDCVAGWRVPKGMGYFVARPVSPVGPWPGVFGHDGYGGSVGLADPRHRFAFALTKTRLTAAEPGRTAALHVADVVRSTLGLPGA